MKLLFWVGACVGEILRHAFPPSLPPSFPPPFHPSPLPSTLPSFLTSFPPPLISSPPHPCPTLSVCLLHCLGVYQLSLTQTRLKPKTTETREREKKKKCILLSFHVLSSCFMTIILLDECRRDNKYGCIFFVCVLFDVKSFRCMTRGLYICIRCVYRDYFLGNAHFFLHCGIQTHKFIEENMLMWYLYNIWYENNIIIFRRGGLPSREKKKKKANDKIPVHHPHHPHHPVPRAALPFSVTFNTTWRPFILVMAAGQA